MTTKKTILCPLLAAALAPLLAYPARSFADDEIVTAFRTPYVETPDGPYFDPANPGVSAVEVTRPLVERGMSAKAVRDILGTPGSLVLKGQIWIYWNYRSTAEGPRTRNLNTLLIVFDGRAKVDEMRLVDSRTLRAQWARVRKSGLAALD